MPGPTLTPEQIAQLKADKEAKLSLITTLSNSIEGKQKQVDKLTVSDSAFKSFFDYYNTGIIAKYEAERKAIDGQYIAQPITESDVLGPATVDGSVRTTPVMPQTDILRVDEFDGGPLVQEPFFYEQKHIEDQGLVEDYLGNGFPFTGTINPTTETTTALTSSSTSLGITDSASYTINPGDYFAVTDGITAAIIKVLTIVDTTPPVVGPPPPTPGPSTATLTIEVIINPIGTLASGSECKVFDGFTNLERTNKDASDASLQPIMDALIVMLSEELNNRLDRLDEQTTALNANQDPNQTDITSAKNNIQLSKSFIENYLVGMDISDPGLNGLATDRGDRLAILSTRLSQISSAVSSFYDSRYDMANNRANTARGTLRLQKATEGSLGTIDDLISAAQAQIDAIDDLLGL